MKAVLKKALARNLYCQECGTKEKEFVVISPNNVKAKLRLCMKCFKRFFKEVDII